MVEVGFFRSRDEGDQLPVLRESSEPCLAHPFDLVEMMYLAVQHDEHVDVGILACLAARVRAEEHEPGQARAVEGVEPGAEVAQQRS